MLYIEYEIKNFTFRFFYIFENIFKKYHNYYIFIFIPIQYKKNIIFYYISACIKVTLPHINMMKNYSNLTSLRSA